MHYILALWLATLLRVVAENQFISPRNHSADGQGKYTADSRWPLGSSQLVAFQTNWKEYRIELWQQPLQSGAKKSSNLVYSQNVGQDLAQSFYWTVQTYELLLSDSPVFFFELQDSNSTAREVSAYFNITIATAPINPITTGSCTAPTVSTVSMAPTAPSASTISAISTIVTEASFPASGPPKRIIMTQGLSAGAAVGIGIGVSLGVILVAAMVGFVFLRRRRHQQQQQQPAELQGCEPPRMELPG
ncbi:hypothetical protein F4823DRAFT_468209 [Ustulina deusta]|nr:hypothetical protein F4823DRAFT_468209 [Ustulina deusta]